MKNENYRDLIDKRLLSKENTNKYPTIQELLRDTDLTREQILVKEGLTVPKRALITNLNKCSKQAIKDAKKAYKELKTIPELFNRSLNEILITFSKSKTPNWGGLIICGNKI